MALCVLRCLLSSRMGPRGSLFFYSQIAFRYESPALPSAQANTDKHLAVASAWATEEGRLSPTSLLCSWPPLPEPNPTRYSPAIPHKQVPLELSRKAGAMRRGGYTIVVAYRTQCRRLPRWCTYHYCYCTVAISFRIVPCT